MGSSVNSEQEMCCYHIVCIYKVTKKFSKENKHVGMEPSKDSKQDDTTKLSNHYYILCHFANLHLLCAQEGCGRQWSG